MRNFVWLLMLAMLGCAPGPSTEPQDIIQIQGYWSARFTVAGDSSEQNVNLPHIWKNHSQTQALTQGSYRFDLGDIPSDQTYAILIPKLVMDAKVSLNGVVLFDAGHDFEQLLQYWNTPILAYLPRSALGAKNTLQIHVRAQPGFGVLAPIYIGPKQLVEAHYQKSSWLKNRLNVYLFVASMAVGVFSVFLGLSQRAHRGYLYFALSAFFWGFYNLSFFIIEVPVSTKLWWWWVNTCIDWWSISFVLFTHRFTGQHLPRFEQALLSFGLGASVAYYIVADQNFITVTSIGHGISTLLYVYIAVVQLKRWFATRANSSLLLASGAVLLIASAVHDLHVGSLNAISTLDADQAIDWLGQMVFLTPLVEPVIWVSILWDMIKRYALVSREVEDLQVNLESKIASTIATHRREQAAEQGLVLTEMALAERRSIYQNLYDDLAEKLSIIYHTALSPQQADAAQAAIAELRDTARTDQKTQAALTDALADIKRELYERFEAVDINLAWEAIALPPVSVRGDTQAIALTRILREAASNVIKHAAATEVRLTLNYLDNTLIVRFIDNGRGMAETSTEGRGINNMRRRAREVGGEFSLRSSATGTTLDLVLPCKD